MRIETKSSSTAGRAAAPRRGIAAAIALFIAGCVAGPPVQEMSDARQAISVAREAGASQTAPEPLRAAEDHLASALRELSASEYKEARKEAIMAKDKALEALATAEAASQNQSPN